jgi:hypothetical protein
MNLARPIGVLAYLLPSGEPAAGPGSTVIAARRGEVMNKTYHEISLRKGAETYVFRFDEHNRKAVIGVFARFANDAHLSFTWRDAAELCKRIRNGQTTMTVESSSRLAVS